MGWSILPNWWFAPMVRTPTFDDDAPGRRSNALVLATRGAYADRRALAELADVSPLHANVLAVTYGLDAEEWLTDWREQVGGRPADMAVLSPGEFARSAAAATSTHELPGRATVEALDDPTDLSTLGERVRAYLARWRDESRHCVVLFEDVTSLLEHVPRRTAFGFLHLLAYQTRNAGALGWFYADPVAHSPATIGVVSDLFDAVVRPDDDGWRATREYHPPDGAEPSGDGATNGHDPVHDDWREFDDDL